MTNEYTHQDVLGELWLAIREAKICSDFGQFFDMMTNKILSNFLIRDSLLNRYSIQILRSVIDKSKRISEETKTFNIGNVLCEKFFSVAETFLSDKPSLKIRSELLQSISSFFLDDQSHNYIENAHTILEKLQSINQHNNQVDALRFTYDLLGICSAISNRKIFAAVVRVFYPRSKLLFEMLGRGILADPQLLNVILDYYSELLR